MAYKRNPLALAVHNGVATMAVAGKLAEATERVVSMMTTETRVLAHVGDFDEWVTKIAAENVDTEKAVALVRAFREAHPEIVEAWNRNRDEVSATAIETAWNRWAHDVPPPVQVCPTCFLVYDRDASTCPACGASSRFKGSKRIRVRSKPLTEADIVEGGVYVPKRGNNKTPNWTVTDVERVESERYGVLVIYDDGKGGDISSAKLPEFLKLVARRVDA